MTFRKLIAFNHVSVDGYFVDANNQFHWARKGNDDPEYAAFVAENAGGGGQLILGRVTYELMAGYWPTPIADQHHPEVARGMNSMSKVVFSRTLRSAAWNNTTVINGELVAEIARLKAAPGPGMAILGSGRIVAQLAQANAIDEYQIIVDPFALGGGRTMFEGLPQPLALRLVKSRQFRNGKLYLAYEPLR